MITWIKSKIFYAKLKIELFKTLDHSDDWIKFLTSLAVAYKDATPDTIKAEFMGKLCEKIHEDAQNEKKLKAVK